MIETPIIELTKNEIFILKEMRKYQGHAIFHIYKQPTKENKEGELIRIVIENSILVEKN